ncbi:hypothetical protein F0562_018371 [Nyssa sinensis]|uniref:Uncharacterized protein n=1 Tax=Nyssa sinensis TaxID=561372 RepID=A0A5J4ZBP9_9ASTE|nr:hypothetical protein F0562_018371 [Nyssa sinensis]
MVPRSMTWDSKLIHSLFLYFEASDICRIPLGIRAAPDRLIWHFQPRVYLRCFREEVEWCCIILWGIWNSRNAIVHGGSARDPDSVDLWAKDYLEEFKQACRRMSYVVPGVVPIGVTKWRRPHEGNFKLNVDGRWILEAGSRSIGGVIWD